MGEGIEGKVCRGMKERRGEQKKRGGDRAGGDKKVRERRKGRAKTGRNDERRKTKGKAGQGGEAMGWKKDRERGRERIGKRRRRKKHPWACGGAVAGFMAQKGFVIFSRSIIADRTIAGMRF